MYTCTLNHVRLERYYVDYPQSRLHHILHYIHRVTPNPYFLTHTKETPCCTISRLAKDSLKNAEKKKDISVSTFVTSGLDFAMASHAFPLRSRGFLKYRNIFSSSVFFILDGTIALLLPTPTPRVLFASGPLLSFELCQKI